MVNSFYADPAVGGDGSTTTDDGSPTTGLANDGFRLRLLAMFTNVVNIANYVRTTLVSAASGAASASASSAAAAAASAASALGAPGTNATTSTSITPATGNINFTLNQTGKAYGLGQTLLIASAANAGTKWVQGALTAFNSGTGVGTIAVSGSSNWAGTVFSDGQVSLGSTAGVQSVAGLSGAVTASALKSALSMTTADLSDYASDQATKATAQKALSIAFAISL